MHAGPMLHQILRTNKVLAEKIGNLIIQVYWDAKKFGSVWSWPARFVAIDIGTRFNPCDTYETFNPAPSSLSYVNPASHPERLQSIVALEIYVLQQKLKSCLALSLRVYGSVDSCQVDNEHLMVKAVSADGTEETIFLGIAQPQVRGTSEYVDAIKRAISPAIPCSELLPLLSSIATYEASINTGKKNSLWCAIDRER